jgi:hypothetical protein
MEKEICECKRAYKEALSGICELCWDEKYPDEKETLEEAAERYWVKQPYNEDAFIEGAKWQQQNSYSEEDMRKAYDQGIDDSFDIGFSNKDDANFNEFIEQFKKQEL